MPARVIVYGFPVAGWVVRDARCAETTLLGVVERGWAPMHIRQGFRFWAGQVWWAETFRQGLTMALSASSVHCMAVIAIFSRSRFQVVPG